MTPERRVEAATPTMPTISSSPAGPVFSDGSRHLVLPRDERSWGAAISRFGPFPALVIEGGLDTVARPDLALHALVETMPLGAAVDVALPNVAFADRVLGLLDGEWSDRGPRRHFTRETAADLARECGLSVDDLVPDRADPNDSQRATELLGDHVDDATSFVLQCERTQRGTIAPPSLFAEAVDYTSLFQRGDGTCHSREIALLDGRARGRGRAGCRHDPLAQRSRPPIDGRRPGGSEPVAQVGRDSRRR